MNCKEYRLEEITSLITDYVANGSFKALKDNVQYQSTKSFARLIRFVDYSRKFTEDGAVWISEKSYNFLRKSVLYPGDIIISNVGTIGESFLCPNLDYPMTIGPNCILVRSDGEKCDQKFLYYILSSPRGKSGLRSIASSSAVPKFNKTDLRKMQIEVPGIVVQKKIAKILSLLDEKIERNDHTNDNLRHILYSPTFIR